MVPMRTVAAEAHSAASPAAVFAVVADGARWSEWSFIPRSSLERQGDPFPDGVGAVRRFGAWPVYSREEVIEYDPPHRFAYELRSGFPVRSYRAVVTIRPEDGGSAITWRGELEPHRGTGPVVAFALERMLAAFARGAARRAERPPA
jgi:uncharacterized protein YndB with AHSA1/START domain